MKIAMKHYALFFVKGIILICRELKKIKKVYTKKSCGPKHFNGYKLQMIIQFRTIFFICQ